MQSQSRRLAIVKLFIMYRAREGTQQYIYLFRSHELHFVPRIVFLFSQNNFRSRKIIFRLHALLLCSLKVSHYTVTLLLFVEVNLSYCS